jgi:hypothetical protein
MKTVTIDAGWIVAGISLILLLMISVGFTTGELRSEISLLENQIQDYEEYIEQLNVAYDSLLVEEQELIEEYDASFNHIDNIGVDSLRGYFANRYGFADLLYTDTTQVDSTRH